jgi:hypothetical protein
VDRQIDKAWVAFRLRLADRFDADLAAGEMRTYFLDTLAGDSLLIVVDGGRVKVRGHRNLVTSGVDEAAHFVYETLHDHYQVAHPAFLDCGYLFGPEYVAEPAPQEPADPPAPDGPVLGRAETDAELQEWMVAAFNEGRDEPIRVARNGEVRWATPGGNTVVVGVRNPARIELHTILAEEVSFTKAHRLIDKLSASWGLRFFLQQDRLVMAQTLIARPFVADHLREAPASFRRDTDRFAWVQTAVLSRRSKERHDAVAQAEEAAAKAKAERDSARAEALRLRDRLNAVTSGLPDPGRSQPRDAA